MPSIFNVFSPEETQVLQPFQDEVNRTRHAFREVACLNLNQALANNHANFNKNMKLGIGKVDDEVYQAFLEAEAEYTRTEQEYKDAMVEFGKQQRIVIDERQ